MTSGVRAMPTLLKIDTLTVVVVCNGHVINGSRKCVQNEWGKWTQDSQMCLAGSAEVLDCNHVSQTRIHHPPRAFPTQLRNQSEASDTTKGSALKTFRSQLLGSHVTGRFLASSSGSLPAPKIRIVTALPVCIDQWPVTAIRGNSQHEQHQSVPESQRQALP